jgi:hypothetical protein
MLIVSTDGERLTCGGISLGEIVRFGSLEFIIDYFSNLSLSPKGSDSSAVFVGTAHIGSPPLHIVLEDSANEFYTDSSGEGSSSFPISQRHSIWTLPTPITTTPWPKDAPAPQTMVTDLPPAVVPRSDTGLPPKRQHAFLEAQ